MRFARGAQCIVKPRNVTADGLEITWSENYDRTIDRSRHDRRQLVAAGIEYITRRVVAMKRDELDIH